MLSRERTPDRPSYQKSPLCESYDYDNKTSKISSQAAIRAEEFERATAHAQGIIANTKLSQLKPRSRIEELKQTGFLLELKNSSIEALKGCIEQLKAYCVSRKTKQEENRIRGQMYSELTSGTLEVQDLLQFNMKLQAEAEQCKTKINGVLRNGNPPISYQQFIRQKPKPKKQIQSRNITSMNSLISSKVSRGNARIDRTSQSRRGSGKMRESCDNFMRQTGMSRQIQSRQSMGASSRSFLRQNISRQNISRQNISRQILNGQYEGQGSYNYQDQPRYRLTIQERSSPQFMQKLERLKKIARVAQRKHQREMNQLRDKIAYLSAENEDLDFQTASYEEELDMCLQRDQGKAAGKAGSFRPSFDEYYGGGLSNTSFVRNR